MTIRNPHHNHPPSHHPSAHPVHRRMNQEQYSTFQRLNISGIAPQEILRNIHTTNPTHDPTPVLSTLNTIYNAKNTLRVRDMRQGQGHDSDIRVKKDEVIRKLEAICRNPATTGLQKLDKLEKISAMLDSTTTITPMLKLSDIVYVTDSEDSSLEKEQIIIKTVSRKKGKRREVVESESEEEGIAQRLRKRRPQKERSPSVLIDEGAICFPVETIGPHHPLTQIEEMYHQIPAGIVPYISQVINVIGDGHCGYRAVAVGIGWEEEDYMKVREKCFLEIMGKPLFYKKLENFTLWEDVNKAADRIYCGAGIVPRQKWMTMPGMGDIIANAFNRPVFFYSGTQPTSFFPSFCPPNNLPPIVFCFLAEPAHFVAFKMKQVVFPVANCFNHWKDYCKPEALGWQEQYREYFAAAQGVFRF